MSENSTPAHTAAVVGEPEVVEDEFLSQASPATRANRALVETAAWQNLKRAATRLQESLTERSAIFGIKQRPAIQR